MKRGRKLALVTLVFVVAALWVFPSAFNRERANITAADRETHTFLSLGKGHVTHYELLAA